MGKGKVHALLSPRKNRSKSKKRTKYALKWLSEFSPASSYGDLIELKILNLL